MDKTNHRRQNEKQQQPLVSYHGESQVWNDQDLTFSLALKKKYFLALPLTQKSLMTSLRNIFVLTVRSNSMQQQGKRGTYFIGNRKATLYVNQGAIFWPSC